MSLFDPWVVKCAYPIQGGRVIKRFFFFNRALKYLNKFVSNGTTLKRYNSFFFAVGYPNNELNLYQLVPKSHIKYEDVD